MQLLPPPWPSQWLWSVCAQGQPFPAPEAAEQGLSLGTATGARPCPEPLVNCFVCLSKSSIPEKGTTAAGGVGLGRVCSLGLSGLSWKLLSQGSKARWPREPSVLAGSEALQQRLIVHPALPVLMEQLQRNNHVSALKHGAAAKEQRLQAAIRPAGIKLTLVSHEVSLSFLALASALCRSSSACFAAVAASMSLIFRL